MLEPVSSYHLSSHPSNHGYITSRSHHNTTLPPSRTHTQNPPTLYLGLLFGIQMANTQEAEAEAGQEGYDQLSSVHDVKPHRPTEMSTFKRSIKRDLRCQLSS
jgi:hypothetical protein